MRFLLQEQLAVILFEIFAARTAVGQRAEDLLKTAAIIQSITPINMPDPMRIRSGSGNRQDSEAKARNGPDVVYTPLPSGPDPLGQNVTGSSRTSRIRSVSAHYDPSSLDERNPVVGGRIRHIRSDPSRLAGYHKTYTAHSDLLCIFISCLCG